MNKDLKLTISEFVESLSEEDLRFLTGRLSERLSGDLPEALNFLSKCRQIDPILAATETATEVYEICDKLKEALVKDCKRRGFSGGGGGKKGKRNSAA